MTNAEKLRKLTQNLVLAGTIGENARLELNEIANQLESQSKEIAELQKEKEDLTELVETNGLAVKSYKEEISVLRKLDLANKILKAKKQSRRIKELEDFAIWMSGCGYDFTQHEYFIKQRDKLLKTKQQEG